MHVCANVVCKHKRTCEKVKVSIRNWTARACVCVCVCARRRVCVHVCANVCKHKRTYENVKVSIRNRT